MARPLALGAVLVAAVVAAAQPAAQSGRGLRVEVSDEAMGTTFTVVLYGDDPATLERTARRALDEAIRLDHLISNYKPESAWSLMNRDAGRRPVVVPPEVFELVDTSLAFSRTSGGAFDVTVGALMRAWGFFRGEGALPARAALDDARANTGYQHVRLDPARRTVAFGRPGLELDPGGIGKGYAVDRMAALLDVGGVTAAFISAGGSSIHARGSPPEEPRGWPVTIRAAGPSSPGVTVFLRDRSLSTSGASEKFFRAGGRTYAHIMDPRTGFPAEGTTLASVIAPGAIDSEVWTTAVFVNGASWARQHRPPGVRVFMCDDGALAACGWID